MGCRKLSKNFLRVSYKKENTEKKCVDYSPYGKELRAYHNGAQEKFLTTHHERDTETGLDYRGARFYDSDVARFLSLDPHAMDYPWLSDYVYVGNNPIIFIDEDGKDYGLAVDHKTRTITITAVYYTQSGDNDSYNSAKQATQFWNDQSGEYVYQVGKGDEAVNYTVNFDLSVQEVDNPVGEAQNDRSTFSLDTEKNHT